MSKKERALPKPGKTPFSRKRFENEGQEGLLMADEMAMAAAEGKLDEYLDQEMPGGEYSKKLAMMMMGMTGALPPEGAPPEAARNSSSSSESAESAQKQEGDGRPAVPPDVLNAVHNGDVEKLKELLAREQLGRDAGSAEETGVEGSAAQETQPRTSLEKDMLDALMRIAYENSLSIDWVIARALKLYLVEYQRTGRL
ncbi:MAG: hypothetical protein OEW04_10800 [Nitrospirota bacterium]|nr:hypothetical protein [Nitrospirota bacterium]